MCLVLVLWSVSANFVLEVSALAPGCNRLFNSASENILVSANTLMTFSALSAPRCLVTKSLNPGWEPLATQSMRWKVQSKRLKLS